MRRTLSRIALLLLLLGIDGVALACTGPNSESHITRIHPVKSVPDGAVQMMVDVPYDEDKMRSQRSGVITIPVREVLNGKFEKQTVTISFHNATSCDYFGPTGEGRYLVIYPLHYTEGDPVLDDVGDPELYVIRYNHNIDPWRLGILDEEDAPPKAETYSCFRRGHQTPEAIEACINADEPQKLYRDDAGNRTHQES